MTAFGLRFDDLDSEYQSNILLYSRKYVFLHFLLNGSQIERRASLHAFPSQRNDNEVNRV